MDALKEVALGLAACVLVAGCAAPTVTPTPEGWTPPPPPTPTATPLPPTPTPTPFEGMCEGDPDCIEDYERFVSPVAWHPTISWAGVFRADIQLNETLDIRWPTMFDSTGDEYSVSVGFYQGDRLIAQVSPPPPPGADWEWTPSPGFYEADTFRLAAEATIVVEARIGPRGGAADEVCLWNGRELLDCTDLELVEQ